MQKAPTRTLLTRFKAPKGGPQCNLGCSLPVLHWWVDHRTARPLTWLSSNILALGIRGGPPSALQEQTPGPQSLVTRLSQYILMPGSYFSPISGRGFWSLLMGCHPCRMPGAVTNATIHSCSLRKWAG